MRQRVRERGGEEGGKGEAGRGTVKPNSVADKGVDEMTAGKREEERKRERYGEGREMSGSSKERRHPGCVEYVAHEQRGEFTQSLLPP